MTKVCTKCNEEKKLYEFNRMRPIIGKHGPYEYRHSYCKVCLAKYHRVLRERKLNEGPRNRID